MRASTLANIYCSGDLPRRPAYVGRAFVLQALLKSPRVRMVEFVQHLELHGGGPVLSRFSSSLELFERDPASWWFWARNEHENKLEAQHKRRHDRARPRLRLIVGRAA